MSEAAGDENEMFRFVCHVVTVMDDDAIAKLITLGDTLPIQTKKDRPVRTRWRNKEKLFEPVELNGVRTLSGCVITISEMFYRDLRISACSAGR